MYCIIDQRLLSFVVMNYGWSRRSWPFAPFCDIKLASDEPARLSFIKDDMIYACKRIACRSFTIYLM